LIFGGQDDAMGGRDFDTHHHICTRFGKMLDGA
jgi:hypothetical protein